MGRTWKRENISLTQTIQLKDTTKPVTLLEHNLKKEKSDYLEFHIP